MLSEPSYRAKTRELQQAYAGYPGATRAADAILDVARTAQPVG